jgi:4-hydroxybenzoate polyprenyltransferase
MIILGWLFFSIAAALFAERRRNRNAFGWFVVALVFSPLVAFVLLAILDPRAPLLEFEREERERRFKAEVYNGIVGVVVILVLAIGWMSLF